MRLWIIAAAAGVAAFSVGSAARADGPGDAPVYRAAKHRPHAGPRHHGPGGHVRHGLAAEIAAHGPPPRVRSGYGAVHRAPAILVEYREAYIGRGLVYNVPPEPRWARARGYAVVSAKN